ncbi:substrate-binding domain-containing protein [Paenibacillus hexagrammi]|uniref:Substrate-binding domain-containing protein n=1 Tax=Paenibacillus hexagrammi TaxID=2908839 RepID=A0ABY3SFR0_9BACL|nr:substrate-binding domain-containing protein [Paenibacillus sp. YPD9-1]UJF32741.1 substrate-binding domain-containing protein [Paenibacillus sp. YPD9-1]
MEKTIKIGRFVFLFLLAVASLSSCSREIQMAQAPKKMHFEVVLRSQDGDYWKTVKMGAEVAAKEFEVSLDFRGPADEADVLGQIALMEQSIQSKPDAIVLAANDYNALADTAEKAVSLGIPVITIDSAVHSDRVTSFIGVNNYDAGQLAGEQLVKQVGTHGNVAIVSFKQGEHNAEEREKGLMDEISKYPALKVVSKVYGLSNRDLAGQLTRQILSTNNHVDGIVALSESSSVGAASEIQLQGLQGTVKTITFGSTSEELELLQEGVIQSTIIQNPFSIGYLGVKYAVEAAEGRKVPTLVSAGVKAIDLDNMFWSDNQKLLFPFVK